MPGPPLTHSLGVVAEKINAPSERWVLLRVRNGTFPARKIGRNWVMTDQDIADALDVCSNGFKRATKQSSTSAKLPPSTGLTPTSRRRLGLSQ